MRNNTGEDGYILLETLVAVSILTAAVLAAGVSIANAVSVADRASRSAASVDAIRQDFRRATQTAQDCAQRGGDHCETRASGWVTYQNADAEIRIAHPPIENRDCHFDFVSRQCRPL